MQTNNEKYNEFLARFDLPGVEPSSEKEFKHFKTKICGFLKNVNSSLLRQNSVQLIISARNYNKYCEVCGGGELIPWYPSVHPNRNIHLTGEYLFNNSNNYYWFVKLITLQEDIVNLLYFIELLFNEILIYRQQESWDCWSDHSIFELNDYRPEFQELIDSLSINVNVSFAEDENGHYKVYFYPRGDKILDNALVNEVHQILTDNSKKQYEHALQFYRRGDYENAANSLRKTLESWLKSVFGNNKTLGNMLKGNSLLTELNKKLKEIHGNDKSVEILQTSYIAECIKLFNKYETPHNNAGLKHAKSHVVPILEAEIEFMLYQTGAIIRFINKLLQVGGVWSLQD